MSAFSHFRILVHKELLQLVKDRKMCFTIFVSPIWMIILFGYSATMDLAECPFAVLDRARTAETRNFVAGLDNSSVFVRRADFVDEADMRTRLAERDVKLGVVFPPSFTQSRTVELVSDGRNTISAGMATIYAGKILNARSGASRQADSRIVFRGWFNPDFDARWFTVPCLLSLIILSILTLLVALSLSREREAGTMDQLHLTPYSPFEQLLAKGVSGLVIGVLQTVTALVMILFWFKCPFTGSPTALLALLVSFLMSAVGLGLLISVNCSNMQQSMITTILFAIPLTLLSGIATPVSSMPWALQKVAMVNPVRWANDALKELFLEGAGFEAVAVPVVVLLAMGLGSFILAWAKFRRA